MRRRKDADNQSPGRGIYHKLLYAEGQEPGRGFLVDPADNPKKLISILEEKQICPEAILLTHGHYDHILAVPKLQERWKEIPVYCNAKDIPESLTEYDMGQQFPTVQGI